MTLGVLEERLVVIRLPCVGLAVMVTMIGPGVLVQAIMVVIGMVTGVLKSVVTGELVSAGGGMLLLTMMGWIALPSRQLLALTVQVRESVPTKLRLGTYVILGEPEARLVVIRLPCIGPVMMSMM